VRSGDGGRPPPSLIELDGDLRALRGATKQRILVRPEVAPPRPLRTELQNSSVAVVSVSAKV
jgi:hypothetical protein